VTELRLTVYYVHQGRAILPDAGTILIQTTHHAQPFAVKHCRF
jgi:hypothetical protein